MFAFPVHHEDLLLQREDRFCAQEVRLGKTASVVSRLEDVQARLSSKPDSIFDDENFSMLYGCIRYETLRPWLERVVAAVGPRKAKNGAAHGLSGVTCSRLTMCWQASVAPLKKKFEKAKKGADRFSHP